MRMAAALSFEFDQFALLQIRECIVHIGSERVRVCLVFFRQFANDLTQCSSVATGKDFVRGFVQLYDSLRIKQYTFTRGGIDL